uniref:Protein TsetseEP domain-containing protein n=1 Tax=Anopheles farauti TaxID=69004 RepID=A0A182QW67_9DIPT
MARVDLAFAFLLGCALLQHAFASPEFGSIGTVSSSFTIKNTVDSITPLLDAVDNNNGRTLKTDYSLLVTVLPLMEALGTNVASLGSAITTKLSASVPKNDGNLNAAIDPVIDAIAPFKNFIDTLVASTRATLKALLGDDIDHLFGDVFGNMKLSLDQLERALLRLKGALASATIKAGRAQVDPALVMEVLVAASYLKATVTPVDYTIRSSIENVGYADDFLDGLQFMTTNLKESLEEYFTQFRDTLTDDGAYLADIATDFKNSLTVITNGVPAATSAMSSLPDYADMSTALTKFGDVIATLQSVPEMINQEVTKITGIVNTFTTDYASILVPRSYVSITYLMEVLISGGKYSRFCFFKYSPRLINYYALLVSDVESCYNYEIYRLESIIDVAIYVNTMIAFDLEDLIDNLTACNTKASPGPCIKAIGPYYIKLSEKTVAKLATLIAYSYAETKAATMRLGSCILTSKLENMQKLVTAVKDIQTCHDVGPQDPN